MSLKVDCLLPSGLLIVVEATKKETLKDVKAKLWKLAADQPFYGELKDPATYGMQTVNKDGIVVELEDIQPLSTVEWYQPLIKLWMQTGDNDTKKWKLHAGHIIGIHIKELDDNSNDEIVAFRRSMQDICQEAVRRRREGGDRAVQNYTFPPRTEKGKFPKRLEPALESVGAGKAFSLTLERTGKTKVTFACLLTDTVEQVLKKSRLVSDHKKHALKVPGINEYMFWHNTRAPVSSYTCIHRALTRFLENRESNPVFLEVVPIDGIIKPSDDLTVQMEERMLARAAVQEAQMKGVREDLWFGPCSTKPFKISVVKAFHLPIDQDLWGISIYAAVYLGDRLISADVRRTVSKNTQESLEYNDTIEFGIALKDLPRDAKLCMGVVGYWKNPATLKKKKFQNEAPLGYANTSIFDHRGYLREGEVNLKAWPVPEADEGDDEMVKPLFTTMPNTENGVGLVINFDTYGPGIHVAFPRADTIGAKVDGKVSTQRDHQTALDMQRVDQIVRKDPLYTLSDDDIKLLRKYKYYVKEIPQALPKCLRAVDWKSNDAAHEVVDMLRLWKPLDKEDALGLLDCGFSDSATRSHAVALLKRVLADDTETLLMYLLQLVQVLKYEVYLDCDLARWLLERALQDQRVGHFFFWYLRSEMHLPDAKVRNALLLEAYCKGCAGHMQELRLQVEAMDKLVDIANSIKPRNIKKDKKKVEVQKQLDVIQKKGPGENLGEFQLPYHPAQRLGEVHCPRVMDSKKLPLWLTFKNAAGAPHADINIIFKAGDDLRQDMLTLQLIRIMDQLWLKNDMDFKMNCYECLSTGDEVGMLEVVMNAKTIAGIQGGVRAVKQDDPLYKWLKAENPGDDALRKATDNFLMSCVGYCVATYVLGIGDRHNDNIMVTRDGKLFHIDFGHFLGNWKSKFGIKRERVKFILTPDFVYAMSNGHGAKSAEYKRFKELCKKAYLIVRKKANLFINLLNMMLSTGIPELQTHDDVRYLQTTLCLDVTDAEAAQLFDAEIDTALKDSWSVRANWAAHILAH